MDHPAAHNLDAQIQIRVPSALSGRDSKTFDPFLGRLHMPSMLSLVVAEYLTAPPLDSLVNLLITLASHKAHDDSSPHSFCCRTAAGQIDSRISSNDR